MDSSQWFDRDVTDIEPSARAFLQSYSKIPVDEVLPHVLALRERAFALFPWPCIGQFRFLRFNLASNPAYASVLSRLRADKSSQLLDLGSCFGQDIRKAFVDGIEPSQLVGIDFVPEFNELGYELFRDFDRFKFEFQARDILNDDADWSTLESRFDVIHMNSFLHIWNWDGQVKAASRIATFSKANTVIVGSGLGSKVGGEFPTLEGEGTNYRQSEESFQRLWNEVGQATGTEWKVESTFRVLDATKMNAHTKWAEPNMGVLMFQVTRVA